MKMRVINRGFLLLLACFLTTACVQGDSGAVSSTSPQGSTVVSQPVTAVATPGTATMLAGFLLDEARSMLDLCIDLNSPEVKLTFNDWNEVYKGVSETDPKNDLGIGPFNNAWKLWQKKGDDKTYALAVRGTIEDKASIMEDIIATSVSATQVHIAVGDNRNLPFTLAAVPGSETHLGFVYGLAVLMFHKDIGILKQIKEKVPPGSKIYISGHSQGAAIATMVHAFLYYAIHDPADRYNLKNSNYSLKSYVFAQPKPGNWQFCADFARIAASKGYAYVINNTLDWVPQVPVTVEFLDEPGRDLLDEHKKTITSMLRRTALDAAVLGFKGIMRLRADIAGDVQTKLDRKIHGYISNLSSNYFITGTGQLQVEKASSLNYVACGNPITVVGTGVADTIHDGWLTQHHTSTYKNLLKQLEQ